MKPLVCSYSAIGMGSRFWCISFNSCRTPIIASPWIFDKKPTHFFQQLSHLDDPLAVNLDWCPFFVHVHDLPYGQRTLEVIKYIGAYSGSWLNVADILRDIAFHETVRTRININVTLPLKRALRLCSEDGDETVVRFTYERLSNFCYLCGSWVTLVVFVNSGLGELFGPRGVIPLMGLGSVASRPSKRLASCFDSRSSYLRWSPPTQPRSVIGIHRGAHLPTVSEGLHTVVSCPYPIFLHLFPSRVGPQATDGGAIRKLGFASDMGHVPPISTGPSSPITKHGPIASGSALPSGLSFSPIPLGPYLHLIDESSSSLVGSESFTPPTKVSLLPVPSPMRRLPPVTPNSLESGSSLASPLDDNLDFSGFPLVDVPVATLSPTRSWPESLSRGRWSWTTRAFKGRSCGSGTGRVSYQGGQRRK
ncbi:hypothetical protein Salat_0613200 [Sesamum alatum]|uniref:Zinc knuckle CX2CX4HX4C domain-containing protein n=1 Tax=Sesamum alatum TaxID=300844 RepID=A0AAE1YQ47_9LAMI|nr:hypothetical protein Salat_0613200 [Sesamum alatum]